MCMLCRFAASQCGWPTVPSLCPKGVWQQHITASMLTAVPAVPAHAGLKRSGSRCSHR